MADPNADLIGFEFPDDRGDVLRVTGTAEWGAQYVLCETDVVDGVQRKTARPASVVRTAKALS